MRQGRPQQGCCVFLWRALCGYCDGFQGELVENVRSQPPPKPLVQWQRCYPVHYETEGLQLREAKLLPKVT